MTRKIRHSTKINIKVKVINENKKRKSFFIRQHVHVSCPLSTSDHALLKIILNYPILSSHEIFKSHICI